jgi:hypothetical protein
MPGTLREALEGLDLARFVREDEGLGRIRTALEGETSPGEAQAICEELVRFLVTKVGDDVVGEFGRDLRDLTEVQKQIQALYDGAIGGQAPADLATRLRPLQQQRSALMAELERLSDPHGLRDRSVDLSEVTAREDQGLTTDDLPEEDRGDTRTQTPVGARPRQSAARTAEVNAALRDAQSATSAIRLEAARPTRSYAREQFLLLRDYDPIAAAQGYEVRAVGTGLDIHLDGIEPTAPRRFRILEAKYNDPAQGSIYGESRGGGGAAEGSLRDELSRLIDARNQLAGAGCDGIHVVVNTESGRVEIARVLTDMSIDAQSVGITITVKPL